MKKTLFSALVLLAAACKKDAPAVDPDFGPTVTKVKANLATLAKIEKAIAEVPPLAHDTLALPGGKKESSTLITVEQLSSLGGCFKDAHICNDLWWRLSGCDALTKLTPEAAAAQFDAVNELKRCAALRYVAVARKRAFTKPVADKASKTYQAGHLSVELLVFDLQTAAYLGGFVVDAKSPESLEKVTATTNVDGWLHEQLGRVVFDAMRARIDT
ncbi:MAG: hypothetical protein JNK82_26655 [Myxococcaceae bacterium]|nr:hypothetical protein [Myxococcaceae bacterium]